MNDTDRIGILIGGKALNPSERELLGAGTLIDTQGFSVTLLGKKKSKARVMAEDEGLEFVGLGKITKRKDFNAALKLSDILKKKGVTTILFRDPGDSGLLVTTKFLMKGRLRLIFIQDRPIRDMTRDFLLTFQFNQIDAWVTPLMNTAKNVKTATNLDHSKVHVFPLPVPRKPFVSLGNRRARDQRKTGIVMGWNLPPDKEPATRTSMRIADCFEKFVGLSLIINAPGLTMEEVFERLPLLRKFKTRIKMASMEMDEPTFYDKVDVCFLDPEYEPFGGMAIRCLFSGVPPIVPKSMLSNELFENGDLAWTYDTEDPSFESAARLYDRLGDPDFQSEFRQVALKRLGKRYTRKRFKQNIHALIEALPEKSLIH